MSTTYPAWTFHLIQLSLSCSRVLGCLQEALKAHLGQMCKRRKKIEPSPQQAMAAMLREHIAKLSTVCIIGCRLNMKCFAAWSTNKYCSCAQASETGAALSPAMLAAAEAVDVDQLPIIQIRTPTLYSLLPGEQVPLDKPQLLLQCLRTHLSVPNDHRAC